MLRRLIIIGLVFATTLGLLFLQNKILVGEQELQAELRPIEGSTTASTVVFKDLAGNFIPASAHEVAQIKHRLAGDRKKKEIAATVEGPTPQDTLIVTATKAGEDQISLRQRLVGSPFRRPNPTRPLFHVTRGIDLQGGVEFVCQLFNAENKRVDAGDEEMRVLRNRLDARGLTEPTVTRMSNGDIQVVIPGGSRADAARTRKVLETTGRLEFREVIAVYGDVAGKVGGNHAYARTTDKWTGTKPGDPDCAVRVVNNRYVFRSPTEPFRNRGDVIAIEKSRDPTAVPKVFYHLGPPRLTGTDVSQATLELFQGQNAIGIQFTSSGTGRNEAFTRDVHQRGNSQQGTGHIAILFDGKIESDPHIETPSSSNCVIHGIFTKDEIESLQNALKGGSLAVTPVVISERVVGATLGVETVNRAIQTMLWSFAAIVAFLAFYYRRLGLVAMGCMVVLAALTYSALSVFGATLTLPGIAGLVLSVAMSIDTNVLIYERIREEQRAGKEARDAIEAGYDRAFLVIIDSHLTTMLTGVILYYVGSGPVKGFGLTLMLGVAISLFSNVYASRLFTDFICRGQKKIGMANLIPEPRLPYVGMRKITYALSIITGLAGVGWFMFGHHVVGGSFQRNFDIEFTGGNLVQVNFDRPLDRAQVEAALDAAHKAAPPGESMLDPTSLSEPQAYFSTFGQDGASRQWVFRARDEAGSLIEERRQELSAEQGALEREVDALRDGGDAVRKRDVERQIEAKIKEVDAQQRLVATRTDQFKRQLADAFAGSIAAEGDEITAASWNDRTLSLTLATLDRPNQTALDSAAAALRRRETLESVTVATAGDAAVKVDVTYRQAPTAEPTWEAQDEIAQRLVALLSGGPGGSESARDPARLAVDIYDAAVNALASQRIAVAKPFPASEHFSGQVAGQMKFRALVALLIAMTGMLFYIAARFEFGFGVGAVVALVHDILLTLGLMSLLGVRIDLTVVAALLTIIGYSVNDTIVVFDRIRENLKKMVDKPLAEIIDLSVAQTMPRTVLTGGGTILAIIAMIIFAGDAVRPFAITLLIGTVLGTYSSIFVAAPILLFFSRQKLIAPTPPTTGDGEFGPADSGDDDGGEAEPAGTLPKPV